jgi:hypothetical protein
MREKFIGDIQKYREESKRGILPDSINSLEHKVDWPVADEVSNIALIGFYDRPHYQEEPGALYKERSKNNKTPTHMGVDIQLPQNTPIVSPADGKIIGAMQDPRHHSMCEIYLLSNEGVVYLFSHLKLEKQGDLYESMKANKKCFESLDFGERLTDYSDNMFPDEEHIHIKKGDPIGEIAYFNQEVFDGIAHPDVQKIYGKSYNHLHLGTSYVETQTLSSLSDITTSSFNPMLILKEI